MMVRIIVVEDTMSVWFDRRCHYHDHFTPVFLGFGVHQYIWYDHFISCNGNYHRRHHQNDYCSDDLIFRKTRGKKNEVLEEKTKKSMICVDHKSFYHHHHQKRKGGVEEKCTGHDEDHDDDGGWHSDFSFWFISVSWQLLQWWWWSFWSLHLLLSSFLLWFNHSYYHVISFSSFSLNLYIFLVVLCVVPFDLPLFYSLMYPDVDVSRLSWLLYKSIVEGFQMQILSEGNDSIYHFNSDVSHVSRRTFMAIIIIIISRVTRCSYDPFNPFLFEWCNRNNKHENHSSLILLYLLLMFGTNVWEELADVDDEEPWLTTDTIKIMIYWYTVGGLC